MVRKKNNESPLNTGFNPEINEARRLVLEKALGEITKRYGEGSIMRMGDAKHMQVEVIPTGSLSLDIALGVGGIPRARITEIYGPESSGKTTLCLHLVAEIQKKGGTAAYVDMEHALDPVYATKLGVDIDDLLISQPDTGEQALEITETLVKSGAVDLVLIDSVAALVPKNEIEGDMGDSTMGMQARLMSQALRKLSGAINQTKTAVVFTNQLRQKIGIMFGNPETTTMYNEGISTSGDILDLGTQLEIITKRGAFYSYGDVRLGQGRENAKEFLKQNKDLSNEIELAIREQAMQGLVFGVGANDEDSFVEDEI
jgi:recombination protein RecA